MKKTMFKVLLASLLLAFVSAPAFATDCNGTVGECDHISDSTNGGTGVTLRLSPNVQIGYNGSDTAYAMASKNSQGTKGYGANSVSQGLYVTVADLATDAVPTVPTAGGDFPTASWAVVGK